MAILYYAKLMLFVLVQNGSELSERRDIRGPSLWALKSRHGTIWLERQELCPFIRV